MVYEQYYPFEVLKLEYDDTTYDGTAFDVTALEPNIGRYTVFFHYNEHYLPTLKKLNAMVLAQPILQNSTLEQLAQNSDKDVARAAASVFGHELYFKSLSPKMKEPSDRLKAELNRQFGGTEKFLDAIKDNAAKVYGSGFTWVCEDCCGGLFIMSTPDHTLPDGENIRPIYALDLWEHSYYLDRQNHRDDYVDAALEIINWEEMERNLN